MRLESLRSLMSFLGFRGYERIVGKETSKVEEEPARSRKAIKQTERETKFRARESNQRI